MSVVSKWGNSQALRLPASIKGTIEYLFKDYSGESFKTEMVNPEEPVGKEQW